MPNEWHNKAIEARNLFSNKVIFSTINASFVYDGLGNITAARRTWKNSHAFVYAKGSGVTCMR
jgi:hypothetical protein